MTMSVGEKAILHITSDYGMYEYVCSNAMYKERVNERTYILTVVVVVQAMGRAELEVSYPPMLYV